MKIALSFYVVERKALITMQRWGSNGQTQPERPSPATDGRLQSWELIEELAMARASLHATPMPRQRHIMAITNTTTKLSPRPKSTAPPSQVHGASQTTLPLIGAPLPRKARTLGVAPDRRDRIPMRFHLGPRAS
jgi:hypothetical protein